MDFNKAQDEFIQLWGSIATNWGINKAMAQIHALLLSVENPITTDEIMEELVVSRSNANLNIRALLDWGLIYKKHVPGDRKEYFIAEKDMWNVAIKIMNERRKKEVEPIVKDLKNLVNFEATKFHEKNFKQVLNDTIELSEKLINIGTMIEKAEKNNFFKWVIKGS
jgi:DNA-binding transcriptional regulator GbsR (MarR family)